MVQDSIYPEEWIWEPVDLEEPVIMPEAVCDSRMTNSAADANAADAR
jgi:hypothetical protein